MDKDQRDAVWLLADRAALRSRIASCNSGFSVVGRFAAADRHASDCTPRERYDTRASLLTEPFSEDSDLVEWVKDALTHYWGGPKLTNSPLMKLRIVQMLAEEYDGNTPNALRALLRKAVDQVKPEGERRFTSEWILYNILEMKFIEGRKVREVAGRLAMSEADLYRKQRVAVEAVARAILDMEQTEGIR
jgi:hypothetical protein